MKRVNQWLCEILVVGVIATVVGSVWACASVAARGETLHIHLKGAPAVTE